MRRYEMSKLWKPDNAGKVIPVVCVRPLLPPPPQIVARLQPQHMHWQLGRYVDVLSFGPGGRGKRQRWVVDREAEQHNLILDQTYDSLIPQYGFVALTNYAVVGSGSTPPSNTQTGLANELRRTNINEVGGANTFSVSRIATGVYDWSVVREFSETQVGNLNLTEWGFSPVGTAGNNLISRELFRDGNGVPIVITPDSDQRLRLIYKVRLSVGPTTPISATLTISGMGTFGGSVWLATSSSGIFPMPYPWFYGYEAFGLVDYLAAGRPQYARQGVLNQQRTPSDNLWVASSPQGVKALTYDAYQAGSRQRQFKQSSVYGTSEINGSWWGLGLGMSSYSDGTGSLNFIFFLALTSQFSKDNLHKLDFGKWTLTWGP